MVLNKTFTPVGGAYVTITTEREFTIGECYSDRQLGLKYYELSNHLGNVMEVVSDRKISTDEATYNATTGDFVSATSDGIIDWFEADVVQYSDYYPYGFEMPGRNGAISEKYRYAFNGMETDQEVSGSGNSYTTYFRQYDTRLARWKSQDPKSDLYPAFSPYIGNGDSPLLFVDKRGDVLIIIGGTDEKKKFTAMINNTFDGMVSIELDANGKVSIYGNRNSLSEEDKVKYDRLSEIINHEQTTYAVLLSENDRDKAVGGTWRGARLSDGTPINTIDLWDAEAWDSEGVSDESIVIHELYETYQDQVQGINDFTIAHDNALKAQGDMDGVIVENNYGEIDENGYGYVFSPYTKDGEKATVVARVEDRNIVSTQKVEGWVTSTDMFKPEMRTQEGKRKTTLDDSVKANRGTTNDNSTKKKDKKSTTRSGNPFILQ